MQTFTPIEYLKIDVANLHGEDKLTWNERLDWFKENEPRLEMLTEEADKPAQYYAAVMAYRKAIKGEVNYHPIALDGTFSGLQILSSLCCDEKAAYHCNVLNTGKREDAYTSLFQILSKKLDGKKHITRDDVKYAIMPNLYGSQQAPLELFGAHVEDYYKMMEEECPMVWCVNNFLIDAWNGDISSYGWTMPDNFHVHIKVYTEQEESFYFAGSDFSFITRHNTPNHSGRAYGANVTHS